MNLEDLVIGGRYNVISTHVPTQPDELYVIIGDIVEIREVFEDGTSIMIPLYIIIFWLIKSNWINFFFIYDIWVIIVIYPNPIPLMQYIH